MMQFWEILLLAVALAMDCFTVSAVSGVIVRRWRGGTALRLALLFGLFQALMPLIGWVAISFFRSSVEAFDHWIAFGMLAFLGVKMIRDAFAPEEEKLMNPVKLRTQLALAVATSIDALAVGISMGCSGYETLGSLVLPLGTIGLVSFLMSIVGFLIGVRFGETVARRWKPELFGGVILLAIGVKILLEHLLG